MNKPNIYFIVSHPIQYFVPLYKKLSENNAIHTKVLFLSDETLKGGIDKQFGVKFTWDIPLLEGYEYKFVKNWSWKPSIFKGFWGLFNPGIIFELWKLPKGMVILSGWHFSTYWLGYFFAFLFGHTVAIRCEAPAYKEIERKGLKNRIRHFLIGKVLLNGLVDRCLYLGHQNKAFFKHYLIAEDKLFFSPYSIDNERFRSGVALYDKQEQRMALGIEKDDFVILFTGKFIPVKRPLDLVKAFQCLETTKKRLVLVGDGLLKDEMLLYISKWKIEHVHFTGFINQKELPRYYALADVLVLCSESETWGLSVNEAMACGLPVIVSDGVGCADDLVINGRNGYVFPKGDVDALSRALKNISDQKDERNIMGHESEAIIGGFTLDKTAEGILTATHSSR